MKEIPDYSETKPSTAQIFEHLFPGNRWHDLPIIGTGELRVAWRVYVFEQQRRVLRFLETLSADRLFVEREQLGFPLDRFFLTYLLGNLYFLDGPKHPKVFRNYSFADQLKEGEKLGGAAIRRVSFYNPIVTQLEIWMRGNPYAPWPEILLGVLDRADKPAAIIHFAQGDRSPGKTRRVKKVLTAPSLIPVEQGI